MTDFTKPEATSPLSVWLDYLGTIHTSSIDLGLERVLKVAQAGQLTQPKAKVITVAGTNGKGSTCAMLEAILLDAGYSVGVYSSPHLIRYHERVRVNGQELSDQDHVQALHHIEMLRAETSLSFFEFTTLSALYLFEQKQLDVILLEVGLGGRLDATNVVEHDVSLITSLALDHVDWLGDDIKVIGYEKAGIFRAHKPAICGQPNPPETVAAHADDIGADFYQVGIQFNYQQHGETWSWQSGAFHLEDLPVPNLPLANAATALMALGTCGLEITDVNIANGLRNAQLAGRMQVLEHSPTVLLDVAHNPHSAQYLVEQLGQRYGNKPIHAVVAMLHDKDIAATLKVLEPVVDHWYPASLQGPRAASAEQLAEYLPTENRLFTSPVEAFSAAYEQVGKEEMIVVVGSFHTVGEVLQYWQSRG